MRFLGFLIFLLLGSGIICGDTVRVSELNHCPVVSITDAILGSPDFVCGLHNSHQFVVIEGDEASLQKALHLVYSQSQDYIAVMFYASWCPFSKNIRPIFSTLASLYPSIPHFAIQESAIRPSILKKYGVHGFPTLFLWNSTMHVRYRGSRSLGSLVAFYSDITGIKGDPRDQLPLEKIEGLSNHTIIDNTEPENCPYSWARSPVNILRQETYLALATSFVVLRLLYLLFPYLLEPTRSTWRRYMRHVRMRTIWEHPLRYLNRTKQLSNFVKDPSKGSDFQEGAINATTWASKSLASAVAIGDQSTSKGASLSAGH